MFTKKTHTQTLKIHAIKPKTKSKKESETALTDLVSLPLKAEGGSSAPRLDSKRIKKEIIYLQKRTNKRENNKRKEKTKEERPEEVVAEEGEGRVGENFGISFALLDEMPQLVHLRLVHFLVRFLLFFWESQRKKVKDSISVREGVMARCER